MDPALDRFDIIDTTVRMAWHADRREWDALNEVFAPQVRLDYTSLTGRQPATVERGDLTYRRAGRPPARRDRRRHLFDVRRSRPAPGRPGSPGNRSQGNC